MSERDAQHRRLALDPARSFLVQAPAGSGKTELLIQRYLALLAIAKDPRRVVAITFTRKAANEMRERVVRALRDARDAAPVSKPHQVLTRELAGKALARADAQGWSILDYPAQLGIGTIDSLCGRIARQAPLSSRLGVAPRPVDDPRGLFLEAARATLASARGDSGRWRTLLARLDNDAESLVSYLAELLAKRDQWLRHVVRRDTVEWRSELESLLRKEVERELTLAHEAFDASLRALLAEVALGAAQFLARDRVALNPWLAHCSAHASLPPPAAAQLAVWRALADWLVVKSEPRFRKRMDRRDGIPPANLDRTGLRAKCDALFARLSAEAGLAAALFVLRELPSPAYDDDAWAAIEALLEILPEAAAQLEVVFAARGTVDYAYFTLAALDALGDADAPSDLLLRLDLAVDHLLVDEFQDTSDAQYQLLDRLTQGWTPGDGRTLFAVGDPMQSIYRFRDAEVRLFLAARECGRIGNVPVQFLELGRNFRSQGHLVAWVNRVFPSVLAPRNDPWSGAVSFVAAAAAHPESHEGPPTLDLVDDGTQEAQRVVARVQAALAAGEGDVAILVRARADLLRILPALRAAGIAFAAVELDALADRQAVRDLLSLTHALVQPADRLAALSVLRAPWCGLVLADLFVAAGALDPGLPGLFANTGALAALSEDGRARLDRVAGALRPAFAEQARAPLADRVYGAWLALGGPATVAEALDLAAADDYFALLRASEAAGDIAEWPAFVDELARRFATSTQDVRARVQVMTLFKAKGLEFDTVVLPGIAEARGGADRDLLKWRVREGGLLIATLRARGGGEDAVYRYLQWLADEEGEHELGRILYVGATRARRRLHLVATARRDDAGGWKEPEKGSLLRKLWDALAAERGTPPDVAPQADDTPRESPPLRRLRSAWQPPALPPAAPAPPPVSPVTPPPFEWAHATASAVGTVSHRLLAQVAREGLPSFDDTRIASLAARVRTELIGEGVEAGELAGATASVMAVLRAIRGDPRARWLFDSAHAEQASEWALAGVDAGSVVHVTLDRSFVTGGVRWIVDFKTGHHEGAGTEAFLDRERERYREQLERYARIVRALDPRPIRLGLYYPLVRDGWREWPFDPPGTQPSLF
ncbi:MAG: UvrD-helicase domain-containing protein [Burkholderiales bacterium]|nr:UvrD-helicase domain-containing protein [Burkholderiales bacterium]